MVRAIESQSYVKSLTLFVSLVFLYFIESNIRVIKIDNLVCTQVNLPFRVLILVLLYVISVYYGKSRLSSISFGLILAGGVFIVLQAQIQGCVQDYISFAGLFRFNVSDLFIAVGSFLVVFDLFVKKKSKIVYTQ